MMFSCTNPFDTRTPEDPDVGTDTSPVGSFQTDPDSVLAKVADAFKLQNPQIYVECISDSQIVGSGYEFVPDQNEAHRILFWDRDKEEEYFSNFIQTIEPDGVGFEYEINTSILLSTSEHQIDVNYVITAEFINESIVYQGQSFLILVKAQNELWYISRWEDFQESGENNLSTWSTLKADFQ